jgi:hypothetical protein
MNAELTELISEQQMLRGKLSTFSVSPNTSTTPQVAAITDRIEELSTDIAELRREQSNLLTSMPALKVSPFNTFETPSNQLATRSVPRIEQQGNDSQRRPKRQRNSDIGAEVAEVPDSQQQMDLDPVRL